MIGQFFLFTKYVKLDWIEKMQMLENFGDLILQ